MPSVATFVIVILINVCNFVLVWLYSVLVLTIFLQFFKLICVGGSDELAVHVEDLALRVHQEFSIITFNLNSSHDHVVFHVDAHLLRLAICISLLLNLRLSDIILGVLTIGAGVHLVYELILIIGRFIIISAALMLTIGVGVLHLLLLCRVYCVIIFNVHIIGPSLVLATVDWYPVVRCRGCRALGSSLRSASFVKRG